MTKDLKIKISIDKKTGELKVVESEFDSLNKRVKRADANTRDFTTSLKNIAIGAIGIYAINKALSDVIKTGLKIESMTMSLEAAVGSTEKLNDSVKFLKETSKKLGLSFEASIKGFTQFASAAKQTPLEGQGVKDVFHGIAEASAVMGLSIDDQNGVFIALSQMMSKGKVQAEELRGQLGERLPGAFQIAARAMNMTTAQLDKFMNDGKLVSDEFLPRFAKQLEKEFGEKAVKASKTARAEQNRFNNSLLEMKTAINNAGLNQLTKDFYSFGASLAEVATKNMPQIIDVTKNIAEIGTSIALASVAMKGYSSAAAIAASTNAALGLSFGAVNRSIILATASTKAWNLAMKAGPFIAVTAAIWGIEKAIEATNNAYERQARIEKEREKASKGFTGRGILADMRYDKLIKDMVVAYDTMQAKEKAYLKLRGTQYSDFAKKQYDESVATYNKIKNKAIAVSNEIFKTTIKNVKKKKNVAAEQLKEQETAYDKYLSVVGTKEEQFYKKLGDDLVAISSRGTDAQIKYYNKVMDEHRKQELKKEQEKAQKINNAKQQAYSQYIQIVGTEEEKFQDKLAQQMSALGESGQLTAEQLKKAFDKLNSDHQISLTITGLDEAQNSMTSMLDSQIALAESGMNWGNSLTGVAKKLENVSKATTKLYVDKLKYEDEDTKLQKEYANKFLEANGNELKQKKIMKEFDDKEHKLNITRKQAEINGYASLAGAIGEAFSKGSAAAEAFQAIQATLGIVNGITAIEGAWASAPFPANLPAVAVTTASVIPLIAQLSSLGGSSGSGGSSSGGSFANVTDNYSTKLDDMNKPIIDRLDKQISLLQTISQRGTAGRVGVLKSHNEFALEMKKDAVDAVKTYFTNQTTGKVDNQVYADSTTQNMFTNSGLIVPVTNDEVDNGYDTYTVQYYKLQDMLNASTKDILSTAKTLKVFYDSSKTSSTMYENTKKNIEKLQQTIYGFANDLSGSINDILDAGKDFKDLFDSITMSATYATKDLAKAQEQVNSLKGEDSLTDYLQKQISEIDSLQSKYGANIQQLLLSNNPEDTVKQTQALQDLETATNQTFNNGVEDAINYLDSIKMVGDAMATSNKNIKTWEDSFKTQEQLASEMMSKFSYKVNEGLAWRTVTEDGHTFRRLSFMVKHQEKLATSYEELDAIYKRMANDVDGLTDAELEALNANKKLLDHYKELNLGIEKSIKSTAANILSSLAVKVDDSSSLLKFQENMKTAMTSTDREKVKEALDTATKYQSALKNTSNFASEFDMNFAQAVAKNQLEDITTTADKQIELLNAVDTKIAKLNDIAESMALSLQEQTELENRQYQEARIA